MISVKRFNSLILQYMTKFNIPSFFGFSQYSMLVTRQTYRHMSISLWMSEKKELALKFYHVRQSIYIFKWLKTEEDFSNIFSDYIGDYTDFKYDQETEVITTLMSVYNKNYFGCLYNLK